MRATKLLTLAVVACASTFTNPAAALDIALTNDDAWNAPGIQVMRTALQTAGHNVTLAASVATDVPVCVPLPTCQHAHYEAVADFIVRLVAHLQTRPGFLATETGLLPSGVALIVSYPTSDTIQIFPSPYYSQFSGLSTIVVNVNFDQDGRGPMWGTFELALTGGGTFEGTYIGNANITNLTVDLMVVGNGAGGVAEGLQLRVSDVHDTPFNPVGNMEVRILTPGGKH